MSPNSYISFNDEGILCGYMGEHKHEEPVFVWTYSTFEDYLNECITPSMYYFMASNVFTNFTKDDLWDLAADDYSPGDLEAIAVDAYFDQPISERIIMHEQALVNLRAAKLRAETRESAAIDAMLEENKPFDHTSPIDTDYCDFMRGIILKARKEIDRLEREIHEEEYWEGGHEEKMEYDPGALRYDPMDE